ncbi:MAG: NADP-dependent oxidoreductase [Solirubrobacterales bacterium]
MRAMTVDGKGATAHLRGDLPTPTPAEDEVLVNVRASSVNPVDNSIADGMLASMGVEHDYPVILGRDYAGMVENVGSDTNRFRPGDQVYGFLLHANPKVHDGAWADHITVTESLSIAPAPNGIDLSIAGAAPLAGITALALVDALDLSDSDVLLIAGATGGVGSIAAQLAAQAGARILAPALPEDESFLRELGFSDVLPRDGNTAQLVRERHPDGVDAVLDLVNYEPGAYDAALKSGARVASSTGAAGEGEGRTNVIAEPTPENLNRLGALLADGTLRIPIQKTYNLTDAPTALAALDGEHTQGKLAVQVA